MLSCASVYRCIAVTCWERADLLALVCEVYFCSCHFPVGILGQVWCLIVSIPDICPLYYFDILPGTLSVQLILSVANINITLTIIIEFKSFALLSCTVCTRTIIKFALQIVTSNRTKLYVHSLWCFENYLIIDFANVIWSWCFKHI